MLKKYGFTLFTPDEFVAWLPQQQVARTVLYVQEHHNVRAGAGTGYEILEVLTKGEPVFVYGTRGKWFKISLDERWVAQSLMSLDA